MNRYRLLYCLLIVLLYSCGSAQSQVKMSAIQLSKKLIINGLFHPTAFSQPKDGSHRMFVCEQKGRIRVIENGKLLPQPFLDISDEVIKQNGYDERGLLGLHFIPILPRMESYMCTVACVHGTIKILTTEVLFLSIR